MTTPQTPQQIASIVLEPCPFCGTPTRLSLDGDHHGEFFELGCPDEKCPAHWTYYTEEISNLDSAIIAWNSRHYKSTEFRLLELVGSNRSDLAEMREENERLRKESAELETVVSRLGKIHRSIEQSRNQYMINCGKAGVEIATLKAQLRDLRGKADGLAGEPRWIVNDNGELGVQIGERCFFCYKGGSIEYKDGKHDDGTPILYRSIGKREFGETVWPWKWHVNGRSEDSYTVEVAYTPGLSDGPPDNPDYKWTPLPAYRRAAQGVEGK